jgi:hypothetical protein
MRPFFEEKSMSFKIPAWILASFGGVVALLVASLAYAGLSDPHYDVQVGEVEIVNDGTNNAIYVRGIFTPALPCPVQGFVYLSTDPFEKEVTSLLLTAKATGKTVRYVHVYCISGGASDGYSRGNGFVLK